MGKGEGKGEGKGGCLEEVFDCITAGIACLCFLLLAGPVLIIVGIVVLASTSNDDRADRISQFNDLTAPWNEYGYDDFSTNTSFAVEFSFSGSQCSQQGQVSGGPFVLQGGANPQDDIEGDSDRVSFQQWKYRLQLPSQVQNFVGQTRDCQMTVVFFRLSTDGTEQTTSVGSVQGTLQTTSTRNVCQSSSGSSSCRQRCQNQGGSYNSGNRLCTFREILTSVCIKVDESGEGVRDWTENDQLPGAGTGCFWNSGQNIFEETETKSNGNVNNIQVYVRSARDPYLNFQYVTDGSDSFGLTIGQKIAIGITCIVVGVLLISFWILTIYCCCKFMGCCGDKPREPPSGAIGNFYYGAFNKYGQYIPGYQAQPYPQQQAPYPPAEGQPMQTYGQPTYGRPQYGYGQGQAGYDGQQPPPYQPAPYGAPPPAGYPGAQGGQPTPYGGPPGYPGAQGGQPAPYGGPPPAGYPGPQEGQYKYT